MKNQKLLLIASLLAPAVTAGTDSYAQTPFSTITGYVWQEARTSMPDGLKDAAENNIPGVLVTLYNETLDTIVSSAITDGNGQYILNNFKGTGTYVVTFNYPEDGYTVTTLRAGTDNTANSAVTDYGTGDYKATDFFTISAADEGTDITIYNLGLIEQANKRVYSSYKSNTSTEWNDTLLLPKSAPEIGELSRVKLFVTDAAYHSEIGIENTSTTAGSTGTVTLGGKITVRLPNNNTSNLTALTEIIKSGVFPVYDGITDYDGLSGKAWNNEFGADYGNYTYPALSLAHFKGSDSVSLPVNAISTVTISGGGNLTSNVATAVATGVFVVYEYDGGILPVTLASFEAQKSGSSVNLQWSTTGEENNMGFHIERSMDGKTYSNIGFVPSQADNGNSADRLSYIFTDNTPLAGKNIYRLKQTDFDGKISYSDTRMVNFGLQGTASLYPNPAEDMVTVYANDIKNVVLYNINGQQLQVPVSYNNGMAVIDVSALNAGVYTVQVTDANGSASSMRFAIK